MGGKQFEVSNSVIWLFYHSHFLTVFCAKPSWDEVQAKPRISFNPSSARSCLTNQKRCDSLSSLESLASCLSLRHSNVPLASLTSLSYVFHHYYSQLQPQNSYFHPPFSTRRLHERSNEYLGSTVCKTSVPSMFSTTSWVLGHQLLIDITQRVNSPKHLTGENYKLTQLHVK